MNERPHFEDLEVWQLAHQLCLRVYKHTKRFPSEEKFRLADQLCRATSSISANIAEGEGRYHLNDQIHFIHMARGSLSETRYFLLLARDLGLLVADEEKSLNQLASTLHAKLHAFIASKRRLLDSKTVERRTSNIERNSIKCFTLIELLTVITIIILLVGFTIGVSRYANTYAVNARIQAEIKAMEAALEAYKADHGAYPPLDGTEFNNLSSANYNTNGNIWLYRALSPTNTDKKAYMHFDPKQLNTNALVTLGGLPVTVTFILDPLGTPYFYNPRIPIGNPQTFDLWSAGIDTRVTFSGGVLVITSTNDNIGNWQR